MYLKGGEYEQENMSRGLGRSSGRSSERGLSSAPTVVFLKKKKRKITPGLVMRKTSEKSQLKDTAKLLNHYHSKLSRSFRGRTFRTKRKHDN